MADDSISIHFLVSGAFAASVPYRRCSTVHDFKLASETSTGVPAHYQRLYLQPFAEEALTDEHTLQSIGLESGAIVYMAFVPASAVEFNQTFDYFCGPSTRPSFYCAGMLPGNVHAADSKSQERLRRYVFANLCDPNATDENGTSVLCRAALFGESEVCTAILSHPDAVVDYAAVHAALHYDYKILNLLMQSGKPFVDAIADRLHPPQACRNIINSYPQGSTWLPWLLDRPEGAWTANTASREAERAFSFAAQRGQPHVCRTIATHFSACINSGAALHYAVESSRLGCVRLLLQEPQIDINATDRGGNTPLHKAFERGHIEICRALLQDARIDVNALNNKGETILHCVARASPKRDHAIARYFRWTPPYTCHDTPKLAANLRRLILSDARFTAAHALNLWNQTATKVAEQRAQLLSDGQQSRETLRHLHKTGRMQRKKTKLNDGDYVVGEIWVGEVCDYGGKVWDSAPIGEYCTVGLIDHLGSRCRSGRLSARKSTLSRKDQGSHRRPKSAKAILHVHICEQRQADRLRAIAGRRKAQASDLKRLCMYSSACKAFC